MDLQDFASYYMDTSFDYWDEGTQQWVLNWSLGYMGALDRFQTIYSRPLHLRTFGFPIETTLPASRTIRVNGDTEVYVLGQKREDFAGGSQYQMLIPGRLATGLGGGVCEVHRKVTQGTIPDLGALVDTITARHYCDTELFGVRRDAETDQDFDETHFVILPAHASVVEDDFIHLGTRKMRVIAAYPDSGFQFARAEETEDERVDVVYKTNTTTHVPGSGLKPTSTGTSYTITGAVRNFTASDASAGSNVVTFDFHVKAAHIGFTPSDKGLITYLGRTANVFAVSFDSKQSEWCLKCRL